MPYIEVTPYIDLSARGMCVIPYPGHKEGCPNFEKKKGCPPEVPLFIDVYDIKQPVFAVYNVFNMAEHLRRMRIAHPGWSERQLRCCLYWQGGARKKLKEEAVKFIHEYPEYHIAATPEAMGINIHMTMLNVGIELEWPPTKVAYQVMLAAKRLDYYGGR